MRPSFASRTLIWSLLLSATATFAAPVFTSKPTYISQKRRLDVRQDGQQQLTEPVTLQTVTTTQTPVATIVETCTITLTPSEDGASVREDKSCSFQVTPIGAEPIEDPNRQPPPPEDGGEDGNQDNGETPPETPPPEGAPPAESPPPDQATTPPSEEAPPSEGTDVELVPIGTATDVGAVPSPTDTTATDPAATDTATDAATDTATTDVAPTGAAPLPISEIGVTQVPIDATGAPENPPEATATTSPAADDSGGGETLVTNTVTNSDGSLSTVVSTQTAAAAEVPGQKLEVLPIGLGVFAGISVIALIVVGLVTYERTKYRKAFRQRKLAETGATMGYGGMAEIR